MSSPMWSRSAKHQPNTTEAASVSPGAMAVVVALAAPTAPVPKPPLPAKLYQISSGYVFLWHTAKVRYSVAISGQLLLLCDQSMRKKAWRNRKPGLRAHAHSLHAAPMLVKRVQIICMCTCICTTTGTRTYNFVPLISHVFSTQHGLKSGGEKD